MLRFFRINDPYRLVVIFLIMVIIRFVQGYYIEGISYYELKWLLLGEWLGKGYQMYSEAFDYTGPIAALVYKYLNILFGRTSFINYGISSLVIIFQAGVFNQLLLKNKAYNENSYLPAFLYVILMVSIPDFMTLSPQLLSLTFILLALRNVLRRIDNQVTDELFLNSGIFIGVATMIYLPAAVFFFVFLFSLILFSSAVKRRILLYLFSFLLVFVLCGLYFFWRGDFDSFISIYIIKNLFLTSESPLTILEFLMISSGFILIFIIAIFKTWSAARLTNFQQKIQQVIWLMFLGGVATFFLSNEKSLHELIFLAPVIAYFWVFYFINLQKRILKTIMPGLLILGLIVFNIYAYNTLMDKLYVTSSPSVQKNTMVIGQNLGYYIDEEMLTPCFHLQLSSEAFEGLDYYSRATRLYNVFQESNPDLIIDELGVMPKVMDRFPSIGEVYKENFNGYEKISN